MSRQSVEVPDAIKQIAENAHVSVNTVAQWAFDAYIEHHTLPPKQQEETNNASSKRKARR